MRTIERSTHFKRDYRRELRGRHGKTLPQLVSDTVADLAAGKALAWRLKDHALPGDWLGYRDCHLRPDLVLIYRYTGTTSCSWPGSARTANSIFDVSARAP